MLTYLLIGCGSQKHKSNDDVAEDTHICDCVSISGLFVLYYCAIHLRHGELRTRQKLVGFYWNATELLALCSWLCWFCHLDNKISCVLEDLKCFPWKVHSFSSGTRTHNICNTVFCPLAPQFGWVSLECNWITAHVLLLKGCGFEPRYNQFFLQEWLMVPRLT